MSSPIMKYFEYAPSSKLIADVTGAPTCELAKFMDKELPDGPEKSAGLRKLLEAKDCFIRAALDVK